MKFSVLFFLLDKSILTNKHHQNGHIQKLHQMIKPLQNMTLYKLHPILYTTRNFLLAPAEFCDRFIQKLKLTERAHFIVNCILNMPPYV